MCRTRDEILEARKRLRGKYGELFDATAALLFRHDPIGISFDNLNPHEYAPEAETILPRLRGGQSSDDVLPVVHREFVRWFDADTAGSRERYAQIASELWQLWQEHRQKPSPS
jgi:hypothetical protein